MTTKTKDDGWGEMLDTRKGAPVPDVVRSLLHVAKPLILAQLPERALTFGTHDLAAIVGEWESGAVQVQVVERLYLVRMLRDVGTWPDELLRMVEQERLSTALWVVMATRGIAAALRVVRTHCNAPGGSA